MTTTLPTATDRFVIEDDRGEFIAGFDAEFQIVQRCQTGFSRYAKTFATAKAAQRWADDHSDCGYGFSGPVRIVPLSGVSEGGERHV